MLSHSFSSLRVWTQLHWVPCWGSQILQPRWQEAWIFIWRGDWEWAHFQTHSIVRRFHFPMAVFLRAPVSDWLSARVQPPLLEAAAALCHVALFIGSSQHCSLLLQAQQENFLFTNLLRWNYIQHNIIMGEESHHL